MHLNRSPDSPATLGGEALTEFQTDLLRCNLRQILESNPFYANKLKSAGLDRAEGIRTLDDLHQIPYTTRADLTSDQLNHPPHGTNLTFPLSSYVRIHHTSGTSGEPLRCLDTKESWEWWKSCWKEVYAAAGVTRSDRVFFAFSFGPFIGFWSAFEGCTAIGALAFPGGGMSSHQRVKAILDNDITVVVSTPTYALHLAEVAEQFGLNLADSSVRITIHAGEPGAGIPTTRRRIETAWGARCYDHAGATEVGAWGFECSHQSGLHLNEAEFIFEVIDPIRGDAADEGELVVTNLGRLGMPVIRYRTGDYVRMSGDCCGCGRRFKRLEGGVRGRVDDALIVRGVNVFPSAIENVIRRFSDIGEFAVTCYRRGELDEMEIRVEVRTSESDGLIQLAKTEVLHALGLRVRIEPVPVGSLPRFDLKAKRFTDLRSKSLNTN